MTTGARACDALRELRADHRQPPAPNALSALLLAVVSLGAWPAVQWALRSRAAAARERATFDRLVWWAGGRVAGGEAAKSLAAAGRLPARPWLTVLTINFVGIAVAAVASLVIPVPGADGRLKTVMASTVGVLRSDLFRPDGQQANLGVFFLWSAGTAAAYLTHLVQVHLHALDVRRFLDEFNRTVAVEEGFPPVLLDPIGWGFSVPWVIVAMLLLQVGGAWAVPLAVAGAHDRRYRLKASAKMRADLVDRVRSICHAGPTYDAREPVVATVDPVARCETPGCNTPVSAKAKFCPRCGARRPRRGKE